MDQDHDHDNCKEQEKEIVLRQGRSATVHAKETQNLSMHSVSNRRSSPMIQSSVPLASTLRRHSHIPEGAGLRAHRYNSLSDASPLDTSLFRKGARSVNKLTASIQKARKMREYQRRDSMKNHRASLPSSFGMPVFPMGQGAQGEIFAQQPDEKVDVPVNDSIHLAQKVAIDPNATIDGSNQGINDILGELVANNPEMDETMEHVTPEKLNLSIQMDASSPERESSHKNTASSQPPFKSPQMKRLSVGNPERLYVPSPARNTRSSKRLSSSINDDSYLSLSLTKKPDRRATPEKQSVSLSRRLSNVSDASSSFDGVDGDNTEMMMEYLVPGVEVGKDGMENNVSMQEENRRHSTQADESVAETLLSLSCIQSDTGNEKGSGLDTKSGEADCVLEEHILESDEPAPSQGTLMSESSTLLLSCTSTQVTHTSVQGFSASPTKSCKDSVDTREILQEDNCEQESVGLSLGLASLSEEIASQTLHESQALPAGESIGSIQGINSNVSTDTNALLQGSLGFTRSADKATSVLLASKANSRISAPKSPFIPPSSTKSQELEMCSPLSINEEERDVMEGNIDKSTISAASPFSDMSNDMSSCKDALDGDDGVTADTAALRDIMADLNDELDEPLKGNRKKRLRRSSAFSLSSDVRHEGERVGTSNSRIELDAADTQDLKGLLSDGDRRRSSLMPINENEMSVLCESADLSGPLLRSPDLIMKQAVAKILTPKSILKKRGRDSTPKRSVLFCPPTAAEYNVGSPAKNFTPMCLKATKKLFSIPQKGRDTSFLSTNSSDEESMDIESGVSEDTIGIEDNLKALFANVNQSNSPRSCGSKHSDSSPTRDVDHNASATVGLESGLGAMLKSVADGTHEKQLDVSESLEVETSEATSEFSLRDTSMLRIMDGETKTIGLESDLHGLLNSCNNVNEHSTTPCDIDAESSNDELDSSFESKSFTESTNGQQDPTVQLDKHIVDILKLHSDEKMSSTSHMEETSTFSLKNTSIMRPMNGDTIGLESDLMNMLRTAEKIEVVKEKFSPESTRKLSFDDSLINTKRDGETMGLENNMQGMLDQIAIAPATDTSNTIELEGDLQGMIGKVDRIGNQRMQTNIDEDDTISLHNVSILQKSEGDTVGLEGELQGLIDAALKQKHSDSIQSSTFGDDDKINNLEKNSFSNNIEQRSFQLDSTEQTIALEGNLEHLLNANSSTTNGPRPGDASDTSQMVRSIERGINDDSTPFSNLESRTTSRSSESGRRNSRRFSLVPSSDISLGPSDLLDNSDSTRESQGRSFTPHQNNEHCEEQEKPPVDLKWKELFEYFPHLKESQALESESDLLLEGSTSVLAQYNHSEIVEKVRQFLLEVCGEIEDSAPDDFNAEDTIINHMNMDNSLNSLYDLQRALRGDTSHAGMTNHITALRELGVNSSGTTQMQHLAWELQVMEALKSTIGEMGGDSYDDLQNVDRHLSLAVDVDKSLSIISRHHVKMAMQETMEKKNNETEKLEFEIERIEADIKVAEEELRSKKNTNSVIDSFVEATKEKDLLRSELNRDRSFAQKNFEAVISIEGIQSWKLVSANETNIAVQFIGIVPEISFRLDFDVSSAGTVTCQTSPLTSDATQKKQARHTSNTIVFLKERWLALQKNLSASSLKSPSEISSVIHHIEWYLGRLDIVGKELSILEVRHNGHLKKSPDNDNYHLELSVLNKARNTIVETVFEFGDTYPFLMDVDISGDVNIISLENHLTKTAKPGFGYMSRSCDVIAAFGAK